MTETSGSNIDFSESREDVQEAVKRLAAGELVIVHNVKVYGILGNANSPTLLEDMQKLKEDPGRQAVGWTVPFHRAIPYVDTEAVTAEPLHELVSNPDIQTNLLGGLGFIRLPAKPQADDAWVVRSGIVNNEAHTIQPYSPTGSDFTSRLLRFCLLHGIQPVMSSANKHNEEEIIFPEDARQFAARLDSNNPLFVLEDGVQVSGATKGLGSYPIVRIRPGAERPELFRVSGFTPELMASIFDSYNLDLKPPDQKQANYPDKLFGHEDLLPKYRKLDLVGRQMRLGILATLGCDSTAEFILDEELAAA